MQFYYWRILSFLECPLKFFPGTSGRHVSQVTSGCFRVYLRYFYPLYFSYYLLWPLDLLSLFFSDLTSVFSWIGIPISIVRDLEETVFFLSEPHETWFLTLMIFLSSIRFHPGLDKALVGGQLEVEVTQRVANCKKCLICIYIWGKQLYNIVKSKWY